MKHLLTGLIKNGFSNYRCLHSDRIMIQSISNKARNIGLISIKLYKGIKILLNTLFEQINLFNEEHKMFSK